MVLQLPVFWRDATCQWSDGVNGTNQRSSNQGRRGITRNLDSCLTVNFLGKKCKNNGTVTAVLHCTTKRSLIAIITTPCLQQFFSTYPWNSAKGYKFRWKLDTRMHALRLTNNLKCIQSPPGHHRLRPICLRILENPEQFPNNNFFLWNANTA